MSSMQYSHYFSGPAAVACPEILPAKGGITKYLRGGYGLTPISLLKKSV